MENYLDSLLPILEDQLSVLQNDHGNDLLGHLAVDRKLKKQSPSLNEKTLKAVELLDTLQKQLTPPLYTLVDNLFGFINSKALLCVVKFNIPEILHRHGTMTVDDLANACDPPLAADRLDQVLRLLISAGLFTYSAATRTYANNATSELIRSGHWTRWDLWANLYPTHFYEMLRYLPDHLQASQQRTAAQLHFNTHESLYEHLAKTDWVEQFHRTIGAGATAQAPGMLVDYPWKEIKSQTVCDLGCGGGQFLFQLLDKYPQMSGALMDLPTTVEIAKRNFDSGGPFQSCIGQIVAFHGGDFFDSVPAYAIYSIKWTLHNWPDDKAETILKNVRRSIKIEEQSRLLIIESVVADGRCGRPAHYGDIIMMIGANGKERERQQWGELAGKTGWRIDKVWMLRNCLSSVIDLRPV
ncbi:O-methyltransferase GliM2 [Aspergillus leporis]|uniref:O-methyltransferase GliM2 n=1 Tax=Aspergillus leporis TaxID=41062 RepID=A0A5N5WRP3_9EURO|nr:O-methyltransferase GliM2 [Aspergillus leporis]